MKSEWKRMRRRAPKDNEKAPSSIRSGDPEGSGAPAAQNLLGRMFHIDLRSLAAFRIGIALVLIWDLVLRARDLEAHYTDNGVLPRTVLIDSYLSLHPYLSVHILHGSTLFEALLFCAAGLCAAALLLGYRTRAASVACWYLTGSLHARNPLIVHGGDDLLRVLLFWAMFVPLGGRWSMDRARASVVDSDEPAVCSWGTAGLMLQLCFMYFFSGALKSHPSWRREGTAVYLALSLDQFATPLARALLPYHRLLTALTFSTLVLEIAGPFVAVFSYEYVWLRVLVVAAFVTFHIGLGLCLELGIFPAVCIAGWMLFLPGAAWDMLDRRVASRLTRWRSHLPVGIVSLASRILNRVEMRPMRIRCSRQVNILAGFFLLYIFLWNMRAGDFARFERVFPPQLNIVGEALRVDQYWNLFAPYPSLEHGWYVLGAHLRDGEEVDLLTGKPVTWTRPVSVAASYRNERWRKYLMNLWTGQYASYRPYYAQFLQRTWNETHPVSQQLAKLEITFVLVKALPHYQLSPQERVRIWSQEWSP